MHSDYNNRKIGLIGYGYWGKKVAQVILDHVSCSLYIIDNRLIDSLGSRLYQIEFQDLIDLKDITHVVVATPEDSHYELVKKLLQAKKNVFVEKPLALTKAQATDLVKTAKRMESLLFVDYIFLNDPFCQYLISLCRSKELGELINIEVKRTSPGFLKPDLHVYEDLATHDIYLCREFFQTAYFPTKKTVHKKQNGYEVEVTVLFEDQQKRKQCNCFYSWFGTEQARYLTFEFEHGKVDWIKNASGEYCEIYKGNNKENVTIQEKSSPLEKGLVTFLKQGTVKSLWNDKKYQDYIDDVAMLQSIREISDTSRRFKKTTGRTKKRSFSKIRKSVR